MNKDYYIVTGANGSIGQAITEALAAQKLPVIMGCRNIAKSQPIRQRIIEKTGSPLAARPCLIPIHIPFL